MGATDRRQGLDFAAWNAMKGAAFAVIGRLGESRMRAKIDATPGQAGCLHIILRQEGPTTPQELARILNVTPATVNEFLNQLEARGLVTRARESADRRIVTVRVTEAGTSIAKEWYSTFRENLREVLAPLTDEELETVARLLSKVAPPLVGPPGGFGTLLKHDSSFPLRAAPVGGRRAGGGNPLARAPGARRRSSGSRARPKAQHR
jgi:DNA-binding MarR family transcriptional regulator